MADAVSSQTLYDGPGRVVMKFTNISDGTGETDVIKVDVSALSPPCAEVRIERIIYATQGMSVRIEWDATADTVAWLVPESEDGSFDFRDLVSRGIRNDAGAGKTGDILFTTVGHALGDTYTIILDMAKVAASA